MIQTLTPHWNRTASANQSKRIEILYRNDSSNDEPSYWDALEDLRDNIRDSEGQFISLDLTEPLAESLSAMFHAALKNARWEESLQFSLPEILRHNPRIASPFINRAILWQRLCDLLIIDDTPNRETVLLLENVDQASPATQHEIARLIRFHETHSIRRTFVFTLNRYSYNQVIPELQDILETV